MKTKGKFIVLSLIEFESWLSGLEVHRAIKLIQNHHTWQPDYSSFRKIPDYFHWLESMENFQVEQNGFAQIAQNFTSFPDGSIAVCRPMDVIPAGIKGANQFGVCIEHFGNFDQGSDVMAEEHKETIVRMNALLLKKFNLLPSTDSVVYHHWFDIVTGQRTNGTGTVKTCPGTNFFGGNKVEDCQQKFIPLIKNLI
jgi:hypothetical protein